MRTILNNAAIVKKRVMIRVMTKVMAMTMLLFLLFLIIDKFLPIPIKHNQYDHFAQLIVAEDGTPLRAFADKQGVWRYPVTFDEVSARYIDTLIAYEDRWFWIHPGVNPFALLRAALQNFSNGRLISGGSTLTMQLARILDPHQRSIAGKLKQIFRALQLEWHYSKSQILSFYLNRAPFGGPIEGVQAASFAYLSKPAKELSLAEAALLSVLPQSPSRYRPDRHPQRATKARNKVLDRLYSYGYITKEQLTDAKLEVVVPQLDARPMLAPILSQRLNSQFKKQFKEKFKEPFTKQFKTDNPESLSTQQLPDTIGIVKTTINANLQSNLESLVAHYVQQLPAKSSVAVLVVNHHNLQVKAYLASADFFSAERFGQVDMIKALRSPGSTLKPFLYAMALDEGLISSHSMLMDEELNVSGYTPQNFTQSFSGAVSMSEALQRSLNIPAIQVLQFLGPGLFHAKLENAGLKLHLPAAAKPNLSMILGGTGVRLEQLVSAYTAFSRAGKAGKLRYSSESPIKESYLMSPGSAWIIRNILSQIQYRHSLSNVTDQGIPIAWKTGTSYGFRDAWAIGMTADYTIGIWTGRPDGTPVPGYYGTQTAVPLLRMVSENLSHRHFSITGGNNNAVSEAANSADNKLNVQPDSVTQQLICWPEGRLQSQTDAENCSKTQLSWILNNTIPPVLTIKPELDSIFDEINITSIADGLMIRQPEGEAQSLKINLAAKGGSGGLL